MRVLEAIESRKRDFSGRKVPLARLRRRLHVLGKLPGWYEFAMTEYRLAGTCMELPNANREEIGFGDFMRWLSPAEVESECGDWHYERSLPAAGLLPIGQGFVVRAKGEVLGIGDPLCVRVSAPSDPFLISVSHETGPVASDMLVVCRLSSWIRTAVITNPI